jgi:flavin-dependent dehydrogenase
MSDEYDVVIAGAGLAGCAAAMFLGRSGLRVALLEAHHDASTYKRLCTASMRSSVLPTLQRLGLDKAIEAAGGVPSHDAFITPYGWLYDRGPGHGYNIRRQTLDPMVRAAAADTPGVDLVLGVKVRELTRDANGRVDGVVASGERRIGARLVVGADGRSSKIAELADLPGKESPNARAAYFAHFRNVGLPADRTFSAWFDFPNACLVGAFDGDQVVLAALIDQGALAEFSVDKQAGLLRVFGGLADGPDLSSAIRTSDIIGYRNYPNVTRWRVVRPGVALIGDAAMVADPLNGAGCGFAFQSAEWLCDAVSRALLSGGIRRFDAALRRYQRQHRIRLLPHQYVMTDLSKRRRLPAFAQMVMTAAPFDPWVADRFLAVAARSNSPFTIMTPQFLLRATLAALRARATT